MMGIPGLAFAAIAAFQHQGVDLATLRPGIHVLSGYGNGNVLVLEHGGVVILVDAQSAARVVETDSALRRLTRLPVRQVVFTHYHEDHTGGMPHWREAGAGAVGHATLPAQMAKDTVIADWANWHRTAAPAEAMPDLTFRDSLVLDLGGRPVHLIHQPGAHTDGDAIVWIPWADVLHVGDLVEPGSAPFIDWWAGGSLDGMIAAAERLLMRAGPATWIVPGHGPVVDRTALETHRNMLVAARGRIGLLVRNRRTLDQIVAARPLAEFDVFLGSSRRADGFVRLVASGLARSIPPSERPDGH